jgi:hypothetical protein
MGADLYLLDGAGQELGYFRDSYGATATLWMFGLTWWQDVIPLLDEEMYLSVENAGQLLARLRENEPEFEFNLAKLGPMAQDWRRQQYESLKALLAQAIALNRAVLCSL